MLLLKNINSIKNIAFSQQSKCCTLLNSSRGFHSSLLLHAEKVQKENQSGSDDKIRVYYGKIKKFIKSYINQPNLIKQEH